MDSTSPLCQMEKHKTHYEAVRADFLQFHTVPLNVFLHLITTPAGILGAIMLVYNCVQLHATCGLVLLYLLSLAPLLPVGTWLANALITGALTVVAVEYTLSFWWALLLVGVSTFLQDVSHWITSEPTFQGSYISNSGWAGQFAQHTYLLLPLVLDSVVFLEPGGPFAFLSWFVETERRVTTHLSDPQSTRDMDTLRQWVLNQDPSKEFTTHWWGHDLTDSVGDAFQRLVHSSHISDAFFAVFNRKTYDLAPVPGMDEVYVSCPASKANNSDAVFKMQHVDGPYYFFPFASVYRCLVAITPNKMVRTRFPMRHGFSTLTTGDVLAFDFNREVHYIDLNPRETNDEYRAVLKLHYVVYPRSMAWYGRLVARLTTAYDVYARGLFLRTLSPKTLVDHARASWIHGCTWTAASVEKYLGVWNVLYLALVALLEYTVLPGVFLVATSYVHYVMYIATFYHRQGVSIQLFQRNVILFKTVSMLQVYWRLWHTIQWDWLGFVTLAMIGVGYFIAIAATNAIGVDRTYFGAELGYYEPKWITAFPYNSIPHPMILGAVIALAGSHIQPAFRAQFPWLIPLHIGFYMLHCAQEQYNVHGLPATRKAQSTVDAG